MSDGAEGGAPVGGVAGDVTGGAPQGGGHQTPAGVATPSAPPEDGGGGATSGGADLSNLSPENQEFFTGKGWKDYNAVLDSYKNLSKVTGVSEDRLVRLAADGQVQAEDYAKLGIPTGVEAYGDLPEGMTDATWLKEAALEAKIPEAAFKAFVSKAGEQLSDGLSMLTELQGKQQATVEQVENLKTRLGDKSYEALMKNAQQGAKSLNLDAETASQIEFAIGSEKFLEMLGTVSKVSGEQKFVREGAQPPATQAHTAAEQWAALKTDEGYMKRLDRLDPSALRQRADLFNKMHGKRIM